jgi:hypothetical protein
MSESPNFMFVLTVGEKPPLAPMLERLPNREAAKERGRNIIWTTMGDPSPVIGSLSIAELAEGQGNEEWLGTWDHQGDQWAWEPAD